MKNIFIFAEQRDGVVSSAYYEMLSETIKLYGDRAFVSAVVFGYGNIPVEALKESGADKVYVLESKKLAEYEPMSYTTALVKLISDEKPDVVFVAASVIGSEMAPGVACALRTGLAAHCTELALDDKGELIMIAPAFGGKLLGEYFIPNTLPVMASIKAGVFEKAELPSKNAEIITVDASFLDDAEGGVEFVNRTVVELTEQPVEKADVIVCAGLGIGNEDNLAKARKLASILKASMGYTRPMVDMGYIENENSMIGSSGKMVKPKLYLGFGVSGAAQHLCGMKDSGLIINVNTNEKAECFAASNYKVVSDSGIILDELIKALEK
ncbi:MAG: electron transfer flavoprotein subunit alpha/FixB family protein [Oscillospiraceae bacterium]|nr:electron transfer flavoprotein subunit alpha/FixB family protein [Oscillospiraceae bacterium]